MKKDHFYFSIICLILFVYSPPPVSGANRALLVGINDYALLPVQTGGRIIRDLKGSLTDINLIKKTLINNFGYPSESIKILSERQATKRNIINMFDSWLLQGSGQGDTVVFYFSGHGTSVRDQNNDEPDGMDEALCPFDVDPKNGKNLILDDELGDLIRTLIGRDTIIILDSCHSGGMTRSIRGKVVSHPGDTTARIERFLSITSYQANYFPKALPDVPGGCLFMTAARENQVALETNQTGEFCGAFTHGLIDALQSRGQITYNEMHEHAIKVVKDILQLSQDPQISPKSSKIASRAAFGGRKKSGYGGKDRLVIPANINVRIDDFVSHNIRQNLKDELCSLAYVKIVSGDNFDLMIDGEIHDGKYKARILNKIGDSFSVPPSNNLEELSRSIKSRLEYAFMFKQLLSLRNPSPHFKVHLKPALDSDRRDYFVGEEIVFDLGTENDGYLLLVNFDMDSNLHLLFPNKFYSNNFIRANQNIRIPNEEMRKNNFVFNFGPPAGQEVVKAIFTRSPIKLDKFNLEESARQFDDMGRITVPRHKRADFLKALWNVFASSQTDWNEDILVLRNYEK